MIKPSKSRIEFSKMLAILNTILYVLIIIFCSGVWLVKGYMPEQILNVVTAQYATTISVYMVKAGVENYGKIQKGSGI